MLERSAVKVASCVLMGEGSREAPDLPDLWCAKKRLAVPAGENPEYWDQVL